jgi:hypothetical protein
MAKKAKSAKKSKTAKNKSKKAVKKSLVAAVSGRAGHPDKRLPIHGDPDHEIVCKWIVALNQYQCRQVPTGGDWQQ